MRRILAVDDNADIRMLLEHLLTRAGFEVVLAPGGREALELLRDEGGGLPDAVVLDVQMPEVDGWETLEAIRNAPPTAHLPVILCTVKGRPEDQVRGWELGCDGYVTKPFDIHALSAEVETVIARNPERRRTARVTGLREARREVVVRARR